MNIFLEEYNNFNEYDILDEAYYGKPKEFETIEKELTKIIKLAKTYRVMDGLKVSLNKDVLKTYQYQDSINIIEKMICKVFKLKRFYLNFYTALPASLVAVIPGSLAQIAAGCMNYAMPRNAYTLVSAYNYFGIKKSDKRIDSTNMTMGCNVDIGLMSYVDLTADEILAIMLHEIGHQMSASVFNFMSNICLTNPLKTAINLLIKRNSVKDDFNAFMSRSIKSLNAYPNLKKTVEFITVTVDDIVRHIVFPATWIKHISRIIKGVQKIDPKQIAINYFSPHTLFGYTEEKYADSFATAYGYGPSLVRALDKLGVDKDSVSNKILTNIPAINVAYDFARCSAEIMSGLINADPHPNNSIRFVSQLNKLKRDLKDPNLDKRVRKELEDNIKEIEDYLDNEYLNLNKDENKKRLFSYLLKLVHIKVFKGHLDYREIFNIFDIEE